jgi:hypothetical protein
MAPKDDCQTRVRAALSVVLFAGDRGGQRRLGNIFADHKGADRANVSEAETSTIAWRLGRAEIGWRRRHSPHEETLLSAFEMLQVRFVWINCGLAWMSI